MAIAIRAARLLTKSSAEIIHDGVVVVKDGRVEQVGSWETLQASLDNLKLHDLGDVTLMPGLFDCHVHLQLDPSNATSTKISLSDEQLLDLIQQNALRLLDAGITTARDLGSQGTTMIQVREMIKSGQIPGPRLQCANAPLTVPGGHAHTMGGVCEGVEGVRAEVRKRASEGVDVIKVMSTGGFMTAGTHPSKARFSQAEMDAIAEEARKFDIPVTTHATGTEGIERAANARFSSIEHCAWINADGRATFDPKVAQKLVDNDIAVCPTMNTACAEHTYFCPWDSRKAVVGNVSAIRNAGIPLIVGTDAGIGLCRFERYADGLTVLADAGYTTREIVAAATEVAAERCGLSGETGQIRPGLAADLAAFEGNPVDNVHDFGRPKFVMARGRQHQLTPIAPLGDIAETAAATFKLLRKGAGLEETAA